MPFLYITDFIPYLMFVSFEFLFDRAFVCFAKQKNILPFLCLLIVILLLIIIKRYDVILGIKIMSTIRIMKNKEKKPGPEDQAFYA